jgi:hypothetical protein
LQKKRYLTLKINETECVEPLELNYLDNIDAPTNTIITNTRDIAKREEKQTLESIMTDGTEIHFGLKGGFTYVDEKDKTKRYNYHARHMANKTEKKLITSLTPSPSLIFQYDSMGKIR